MFTVVKSPFRTYGYSLKSDVRLSYLYDGFHMGWYKFKRDAVKRAEDKMNRTESLCRYFGWQGGTIHQISLETGCKVNDLLYGEPSATHLASDNSLGWSSARTCGLAHRLKHAGERKGNLDFWLGVADSGKLPFYEE